MSALIFLGWLLGIPVIKDILPTEVVVSLLGICNLIVLVSLLGSNTQTVTAIEQEQFSTLRELRFSEERLQLALEGSNDGLWDWNLATDELYLSPRWLEMIGYESDELERNFNSWQQLIYCEDIPKVLAALISHLEGKSSTYETEFRMLTKSGDLKWIWGCGKVVERDAQGKPLRMTGTHKDISYRKQTEVNLAESNNILQSVIESTDDAIFVKDIHSRYVLVNSNIINVFGKQKSEMIGVSDADLFPPELARKLVEIDRKILQLGVAETTEEVILDSQGRVRTFLTTKSPWRDREGKIIGVVGMTRDISERKVAEAVLYEQKQTLRTIIDNAPIWVWMTNTTGRMLLVNQTFCQDVGVPEERFLAVEHYSEFLGLEESANCMASDAACFQQEKPYYSEEILPLVDGEFHTMEIIKCTVKDASGQAIGLIGLGLDVTEERQARRQLQQSEAQFRALAAQEALLNQLANHIRRSLDIDTILATAVQQLRNLLQIDRCLFIWYLPNSQPPGWNAVHEAKNPELPSYLGYYTSEIVEALATSLTDLEILRIDDVQTIASPIVRDFFVSLGYKSLLLLPLQTFSSAIGVIICAHHNHLRLWADSEVELLSAVSDQLAIAVSQAELYNQTRTAAREAQFQAQQLSQTLRQLQKTQTQLIQAEKMSSLGQMVAGIAHEINNPVSFIFGNLIHTEQYTSDLIKLTKLYQQEFPRLTPAIQELVDTIDLEFLLEDLPKMLSSMKMGANRIRDIVRSLRTFSRLDEADMKKVDIHESIDSSLLMLEYRLKAQPNHSAIQVIKDYGQLPLVECYAGQLNQVFLNIIANAIDALELPDRSENQANSKKFQVDTVQLNPTIWIHTEAVKEGIVIHIVDNGPGMLKEVQQRIFDPFFTTKVVGKGTGMGLAISHSIIVEKHKGQLRCISTPGQGTQFTIEIPRQQETAD
ncbi:MAG: PAS domain S-box protein [Actinomycetota bacterium]